MSENLDIKQTPENEETLVTLQPHLLSFWPYYLYFLWYIAISGLLVWKLRPFEQWLEGTLVSIFGGTGITVSLLGVWWLLMVVPALLFSILKIKWNWVISFVILSSVGTFLFYQFDATVEMLLYGTVGVGVLGIVLSDLYRTSHEYILTSFRIITKVGFINASKRSLPYSKITDLVEEQGFLGNIFNYGQLFPLTASRMGTGSQTAEVKVGTGVDAGKGKIGGGVGIAVEGGQNVIVPQSRTYYIMYGIPNPDRIKQIIITKMREKEPAYATETQTEILAGKLDSIIDKLDQLNKKF